MDFRDKFFMWLAWNLPKPLVYWCIIRAAANASTGAYEHEVVTNISVLNVLHRWEAQ